MEVFPHLYSRRIEVLVERRYSQYAERLDISRDTRFRKRELDRRGDSWQDLVLPRSEHINRDGWDLLPSSPVFNRRLQ